MFRNLLVCPCIVVCLFVMYGTAFGAVEEKVTLFEKAELFLEGREFFSDHRNRATLVGKLVYCNEQNQVDELSEQNLTGGQLEDVYFVEGVSNQDALNSFSKAMMFIAGYSFGVELGYRELADQEIELTGLCNDSVSMAKEELSKPIPHKPKNFRKQIEKVFPALGPLYDTLFNHIEAAYNLDRTLGREATFKYYDAIQFDEKFIELAKGSFISINKDQQDNYYLLAFIFLQGVAEGKLETLSGYFTEEQLKNYHQDLNSKSLKVIE